MATMKDVARLAGVSHGTVSNVINGEKGVSLDKVRRVKDAMRTLGYEPNAVARSLKTSTSMQFDVILPNIINPALAHIYTGISMLASEKGYAANLRLTNEDAVLETNLLNQARMFTADGVVLMTCQPRNTALFRELRDRKLNLVLLERDSDEGLHPFVGVDLRSQVTRRVLRLLAGDRGGGVGLLVGPLEYTFDRLVHDSYADACREQGRSIDAKQCGIANYDRESALREAIRILSGDVPPRAVVTSSTQFKDSLLKAGEILYLPEDRRPLIVAPEPDSWAVLRQPGVVKLLLPTMRMAETAFSLVHAAATGGMAARPVRVWVEAAAEEEAEGGRVFAPAAARTRGRGKTLRLLLADEQAARVAATMLPEFESRTGCRVSIDTAEYPDMYRMVRENRHRDTYDVFNLDNPWVGEMLREGVIHPLNPYFEGDAGYFDDMPPALMRALCVRDGVICGTPYTFSPQLLFYRKDYFSDLTLRRMYYERCDRDLRPPVTWEEYCETARFFTRKYNPHSPTEFGTTLGSRVSSGGACEYLPRLWGMGGEVYDASGFTLAGETAVAALENYCESFRYASAGSPDNWWTEEAREFGAGKAAMMLTFADIITAVTERETSTTIGKIGFSLPPGDSGVIGGWILAVNEAGRNKPEAVEFVRWLGSKKISIISTILGKFMPFAASIENLEVANIYPWLRKTLEAVPHGRLREMPAKKDGGVMSEALFEDILGEAVYQAVTGRLNPRKALSIANEKLNRLLRDE